MKFMMFVAPTIPATPEERQQLRPIGRNTARYQQMLEQLRGLARLAEDTGFDAFGITEHYFHSEGFEISTSPMLLLTDLAARTRRIKFLTLGLVAPAWDPIRLAEETAVFDQLSGGRYLAGFARGYQSRWSNVLGQQFHVTKSERRICARSPQPRGLRRAHSARQKSMDRGVDRLQGEILPSFHSHMTMGSVGGRQPIRRASTARPARLMTVV
jgi:hypothetical protein